MPRLLHVFSTFAVGGPQVRTATLINHLGEDLQHAILAMDGNTEAMRLIGPESHCHVITLEIIKSYGISITNLRGLRQRVAAERPDLLLTYNFGAMEAALANRLKPLCRHVHFEEGFGPEEANGRQLRRRVWLRRLALTGNSVLVVPSRTLERMALTNWRLSRERVRYIPNGIDIDRFATAEPRPDLRRHDDECLIGSIGILRPEKRFDRLLRAFAALSTIQPLRLVIVGDGPERAPLEAQAIELGIAERVVFTGFVKDPERILTTLDIIALTSDTEQMPYSLIEAMAAGLPVVATDVGDIRVMLPEAARAQIVDRTDEAALINKLQAMINDPDRRQCQGRVNRDHARAHYTLETMLESYRELFANPA